MSLSDLSLQRDWDGHGDVHSFRQECLAGGPWRESHVRCKVALGDEEVALSVYLRGPRDGCLNNYGRQVKHTTKPSRKTAVR